MAYSLPHDTTRLQARVYLPLAHVQAVGPTEILRMSAEKLAQQGIQKLLNDCIRRTPNDEQVVLELDTYVLSPDELDSIIKEARESGMKDAIRWGPVL